MNKHKVYRIARDLFGYEVEARTEPTTNYWMAWAGPADSEGITLKYDVEASFNTKKEALDALLYLIEKDCAESFGGLPDDPR